MSIIFCSSCVINVIQAIRDAFSNKGGGALDPFGMPESVLLDEG